MSEQEGGKVARGAALVPVTGKLHKVGAHNLKRLAVFLVQGNRVLAQSPVTVDGTFQFHVTESLASDTRAFAVLGPKGLGDQALLERTDLPRLSLASARAAKGHALTLDFAKLNIDDKLIDLWWIWCREYTVSGTLQSPSGCPVPGAEVTVYNVTSGGSGLVETPLDTVLTNAAGQFTATFNWCECCLFCWPCWPIWWRCWPWWWEWDILAVIQNIERQLQLQTVSGPQGAALRVANVAPLKRPDAADLMTGQGFARESAELTPDASRTALIASKLANPQIRELFPWWWWCCENPNIVFSATQGGNVIVDEDPATATRWCFASGQSVTLIGNNQSLGLCPPPTTSEGFTWTTVGTTLVTDITNGYANGTPGTDASDMAFTGTLNLYGAFADPSIPFYQVLAGVWTGNDNPARGGVSPSTYQPLSVALSSNVFIFRAATTSVEVDTVVLGPCSFSGIDNLYMTTSQRPTPPAGVTGLGAFPTLNPGDFIIGWAYAGRMVSASASSLIGGAVGGGVDLTVAAYDASGNPVTLTTDEPLVLMIDTSGLTARIDSLSAYDASGNPVGLSGSSTTACPSYHIGPGGYLLLHVTVTDPNSNPSLSLNEHLYAYEIDTQFGHGSTSVPTAPAQRGYAQPSSTFTPPAPPAQPYGVDPGYGTPDPSQVAFVGGGDTIQISPQVSCCYDFQLWAGKRVTDGETFFSTWANYDFQTATIDVS